MDDEQLTHVSNSEHSRSLDDDITELLSSLEGGTEDDFISLLEDEAESVDIINGLEDFRDEAPKRTKHDYSYVRFTCTHYFKVEPANSDIAGERFAHAFSPSVLELFDEGKITYYVGGLEKCPTTGRFHVQGYMELPPRAKKRIGPAAKLISVSSFKPPHVEAARKSAVDNRAYCLKLDEPHLCFASVEIGKPRDDRTIGQRNKAIWDDTRKRAELGDFAGIHSQHYVSFFPNIQKIHFSAPHVLQDLNELNNTWIVGAPGVGKSRGARLIGALKSPIHDGVRQEAYFKPANNKWWDSYNQEKVVIIDDMELDAKYMGHELKLVADRYKCRVEIKGASTMIRPDMIVVTSNYSPDEIWSADAVCASAVKRRFRVVRIHSWVAFETAVVSGALFNIPVDSYTEYGAPPAANQFLEFGV